MKVILSGSENKVVLDGDPTNRIKLCPEIGDLVFGGIVYYKLNTCSGLIAALDEYFCGDAGEFPTYIYYGNYFDIGGGKQNTIDIMSFTTRRPIAASICVNYSGGGYSDWYLGNPQEMNQLCNWNKISNFFNTSGKTYWTSHVSHNNLGMKTHTYTVPPASGCYTNGNNSETGSRYVIPIRSFNL